MCRLNLRDYLARPKQRSSGDGCSSLSSSPLLSFSPPLHTSPQQVPLSSFWWLPWLAQACWSMLPKSACRRSPPRSLLPLSRLKPYRNTCAQYMCACTLYIISVCSDSPGFLSSLKIFQQSEDCSIIYRISHKLRQNLVFCPISPMKMIWKATFHTSLFCKLQYESKIILQLLKMHLR